MEKFFEIKEYFDKAKSHISTDELLNSYDNMIKDFSKIKLNEEKEYKEETNTKSKNQKTKTYKIKGINITNEVEIIDDSIITNIPHRIKFKN